jgi:hypothetical protein
LVLGASDPLVSLREQNENHPWKLEVGRRGFCALTHLQRQATKDNQIRGGRETKVNVHTPPDAVFGKTIDLPAACPVASDANVYGFPATEARNPRSARPPRRVNRNKVVKVTRLPVAQEDGVSFKPVPFGEFEKAAAVGAGMVQTSPEKHAAWLQHP